MKTILMLLLNLVVISSVPAQNHDSESKSFNINTSIIGGLENGLSLRLEYENYNTGKLILNSIAGLYGIDDYIMLDIGLGYGYPVLKRNNNKLNINGLFTYTIQSIPVGIPMDRHGITGIIELEFVKSWNNFSLNIAPYYRLSALKGISGFTDQSYHGYNSVALRISCTYRFGL